MSKKKETLKFIFSDLISSILAWSIFFYFRKNLEGKSFEIDDTNFLIGTVFIIFCWGVIYTLSGRYKNVFRTSRLQTFYSTFFQTLIGCALIFFTIIIDDIKYQNNYYYYYYSICILFVTNFSITFTSRYFLSSIIIKKINSGKIGFNTIIIGCSEKAIKIFEKLENSSKSTGMKIIGYIQTESDTKDLLQGKIQKIGNQKEIARILQEYNIEESIIAIENTHPEQIKSFLYELNYNNVIAKIVPEKSDIFSERIKMESMFAPALIEILPSSMKLWEIVFKRCFDILLSLILLILLLPFFIIVSILVKISSPGPILYRQKRVGKKRKIFNIIKFRSMYTNSEKEGVPMLTKENDSRVTSWGKIMRKYRIDELPQFYNVLIGEMSFVGPRPERNYFVEKIIPLAPHYKLIFKFKPGITSWGMVKYGYADNVEKMIERLKYDIIYIKNLSIFNDIKVIAYTIIIILQGRGK